MGNVLNVLVMILFVLSYAILVVPAFVILVITGVIKEYRNIKLFDTNILQNYEA